MDEQLKQAWLAEIELCTDPVLLIGITSLICAQWWFYKRITTADKDLLMDAIHIRDAYLHDVCRGVVDEEG